jgi:trehalose/maltose transport system substrate-binding protein
VPQCRLARNSSCWHYSDPVPIWCGAEGSKVVRRLAGLISLPVICSQALGLISGCDWPWSSPAGGGAPGPNPVSSPGPRRIHFLADNATSIGIQLDKEAAAQFTRQTGIEVDVIPGAQSTSDRLAQSQLYLTAESPDVDVYMIDVIWPGILANDLLDLRPYIPKSQIDSYFPAIVQNDTVKGKLVGLPYFNDAGLLYYRTDLFAKYGISGPPQTWDDLEAEANEIQAGERAAGNKGFWGFVWQGDAYEGLTCDALEWQASQGGGLIVDADGKFTVNNPAAAQALARASRWVNSISPPEVLGYQEAQSMQVWKAGNAAFMRNWSTAWAPSNAPDTQTGKASPVAGKFDVAPLPKGAGPGGLHAATLGGWQLAVSRYSQHPTEAAQFVAFLAGRDHEKLRAIKGSYLPSIKDLYNDPDVLAVTPYFKRLYDVFTNAVARPSTVTADAYNEVSTAYFTAVHAMLTGEQSPRSALPNLQTQLQGILEAHSVR